MALRVFHSAQEWAAGVPQECRAVLTIGNFDGVHTGHQRILRALDQRAAALRAADPAGAARVQTAAVTFDPHPLKFLRPAEAPALITTLGQRLAAFADAGLDAALVLPFDADLARIPAREFAGQVLVKQLRVRSILVGENFRFGYRHAGDVPLLTELGRQHGFDVDIIPPQVYRGKLVSSTLVREAVAAGRLSYAARLLGKAFALTGTIQPGEGRGRQMKFPTLNLAWEQELMPCPGVYSGETVLQGHSYASAINVGFRPTFHGARITVESHLLNYSGTVDSGAMEVRFCFRLRDEKKFSGPEELRRQIARDVARTERYMAVCCRVKATAGQV